MTALIAWTLDASVVALVLFCIYLKRGDDNGVQR